MESRRAKCAQVGADNWRMTYTLDLRQVQAPLKDRYRTDPSTALIVTEARSISSDLNDPRHCAVAPVDFPDVVIRAGLHPGPQRRRQHFFSRW